MSYEKTISGRDAGIRYLNQAVKKILPRLPLPLSPIEEYKNSSVTIETGQGMLGYQGQVCELFNDQGLIVSGVEI